MNYAHNPSTSREDFADQRSKAIELARRKHVLADAAMRDRIQQQCILQRCQERRLGTVPLTEVDTRGWDVCLSALFMIADTEIGAKLELFERRAISETSQHNTRLHGNSPSRCGTEGLPR